MLKCPIHELPSNVIIDNFYARLSFQDKTLLDTSCSGSFTRNKEEFKRDLLDRIQENTEGWENDKDRESGIIYDYKCIEAFMDTDKFRNMSATYGLDSQVVANLYKAFASHYELPKKNFDKYHEPYKDKVDSSVNKCVVIETVDNVIPEAYIEKTPFPAKMKEYSVISSAVNKSEKKPKEPEEQIKIEPAVAIVKDLVTENVEDGHIIFCEDASNIVSHPNKPKQVSVPMLSVRIGDHCYYGLCDIGASVSAIPYELYTEIMHEIGSCELEDIDVVIHLANRETISPIGIVRDVEVLCGKIKYPADFLVLGSAASDHCPIIFGRPFLNTCGAIIDCKKEKILTRFAGEPYEFNFSKFTKTPYKVDLPSNDFKMEQCASIVLVPNNPLQQHLENSESEAFRKERDELEEIFLRQPILKHDLPVEDLGTTPPPKEDPVFDLKPLPDNLKYAHIDDKKIYPVIISSKLSEIEEERLLEILKKHRGAIGYTLDDLKGISPSICQHAINMEEDAKPVVEHQRRLIPKMKEVVRNEVLKLLEAGIIYPIADSRWVSPVHCVPKKGGMTVVPNDNDELIPQRIVVGYRMCIDFRKVNKVTKKDHYPLPFIDQMLERVTAASAGRRAPERKELSGGGIRRGNSLPEGEIDAIAIVIELDIISIIIIIVSTIYTAITTAAPRHRCISMNEVRKKLFTISLSGKAAHWYKLLKNGDSIDWEDIVPLFYSKFYPPSEIHKDRNRIYNFWPHDGESIAQAWGRLKSLMLKCPIHELPGNVIIDNFYARLSFQDKTLLDTSCSGSFTRKNEEFKRDLLDRIQENTEGWENDKDRESAYIEKTPFPAKMKEYSVISSAVNKSEKKPKEPEEQIKIEPAVAIVKDLVTENVEDGHIIFCEDASNIVSHPNKSKQVSVPMLSVRIGDHCYYGLCDIGASVSAIPYELYTEIMHEIGSCELEDIDVVIHLANRETISPIGIVRDVEVLCGKIKYPADFLQHLENSESEAFRKERDELEEIFRRQPILKHDLPVEDLGTTPPPKEDPVFDLKPLPDNLKYAHIDDKKIYPVIISSKLSEIEEERLLEILKKHRGAIGYTLDDLKGISPSICQHAINMEEDAKPVVEHQRRLIPKMKEVHHGLNNKDKGLWKEEMDERINKEKEKIASAEGEWETTKSKPILVGSVNTGRSFSHNLQGALPPALDLDSFPCVEEAIRVADEFCDQYRALRREVEILQEENQRLRRMLEYYSNPSTRPSPPHSGNDKSLQVLVQNCKLEKLKLKEILMKREKNPSPSSPKE
ncbi:hypothetical protein QYE76_040850 [Lolium multiflorum]|uniref:Retrotransposon gag domain-containing protein n=1 Tax=Lolium multiflorum TaxID=4521 RepID=A0AAD8TDR8_LOLMU|nr:hypothetical protein QYE76_040850 [Lolium multiflorum]